jgi:2-polyprenyl-6-methoxyphenol hydroxylase-like FAD-dependent oxidoreductase
VRPRRVANAVSLGAWYFTPPGDRAWPCPLRGRMLGPWDMKVLVSGAGVAGPCLAYWLHRHGFEPTLIERAPRLRSGGYIVDFWGAGFDVAERMGLVPQISRQGYQLEELRQVDRKGKRVSGLSAQVFERVSGGRFTSLPRSELSALIYQALGNQIETIFGDSIAGLEDLQGGIGVRFERSPSRGFDLVVGADGLHSHVRRLAFGEEARFERYLGLKVAAFEASGYRPRDDLAYVIHTERGQQVGRFSMRNDRTLFLFVFTDPSREIPGDLAGQKALLRARFSGSGWECRKILDALEDSNELYIDRVSQIRMDHWSQGRVALVGDAAFCVSLLGGQGSALAMTAAYVLAGELARANGSHELAFARYEQRLATFIARKQQAAVRFAPFFAPRSRLGMFLRNQVMKLTAIPWVADLVVGRELRDGIELPEY